MTCPRCGSINFLVKSIKRQPITFDAILDNLRQLADNSNIEVYFSDGPENDTPLQDREKPLLH